MSVIDELPEGRKEIKTRAISEKERGHAYDFLLDRIKKGEQGYIVFPVIEETEKSDLSFAPYSALARQDICFLPFMRCRDRGGSGFIQVVGS